MASFELLAQRTVRSLEERIEGTWLTRTGPVAVALLALITLAESSTLLTSAVAGMLLHALALVLMVTHAAITQNLNPGLSRLLIASAPMPLVRIVSLTSPLAQFSYVQWFTVIGVILYAAIVTSMKLLNVSYADVGLKWPALKHWPIEIGVILMGFGFGWLEYQILRPGAIIPSFEWRTLIAPVIVLYVATGLLEELLFRGLMQTYAIRAAGLWGGVAFVTFAFGILHTGWGSWLDLLFVSSVGFIYSLVVLRTRSILGVSVSHVITNSMLFLVMPFVSGG